MNEFNNEELKKFLKNAKARKLLEKTIAEYSLKILEKLNNNYDYIKELSNDFQEPEESILNKLSGKELDNVEFYDQVLLWIYEKENNKTISK